jgi:ATP-binding cassette subfamily F protein 2
MATTNPNLLLLDEPTNHLDMECIDALADAINHFNGGIVLVSHDFRLLEKVAKTIWVVGDGRIKTWNGDIRSYKASLVANCKF